MPTALGFCPSPPLLVPAAAGSAAAELDGLRAACAEVVRRLLATRPERVVVLGPGTTATYAPGSVGSLAAYGAPVTVALLAVPVRPPHRDHATSDAELEPDPRRDLAAPTLPLPLTLGAWLLGDAEVPCSGRTVGPEADPAAAAAGVGGDDTAVLVMGDGSARRSERAPGYIDPRAAAYDGAVAAALRAGDAAALRDLDPALGAELMAAGVPAWRVAGHLPGPWSAELLYDAAPYGVGYLAAVWT